MIDLHVHSTASDGTLSPEQLAVYAKKAGLSAVALTDHDTAEGVPAFLEACRKIGIEGIGGVEISAKYKKEMHILGLFIDETDENFIRSLRELRASRRERNEKMLALAREHGFDICEADICAQKEGASLSNTGRAHIGKALADKGYAADIQDAFDRYLSKGKPLYVPRKTLSPADSIALIHSAGGLAVLAHPMFITTDEEELRMLLTELKGYGFDGAECRYSEYTDEFERLCTRLCDELGLLQTGGSDFHGDNKPHIKIGHMTGGRTTPDEVLTQIKEKRRG